MEYFEYAVDERSGSILNEITTTYNLKNQDDLQNVLKLFKNKINSNNRNVFLDMSCYDDNTFLSQFIYANDGNITNAYGQLEKYFVFKNKNKSWLKNMSIFDNKIELALRDGNPRVIKQRDRKGRKIITFSAAVWNPQKYNLLDIYRAFILTIEKLLDSLENQALGFVVIVDWTDITMNQALYLTPKILKLMIEGLQDCFPVNFKAIHFICQPWYLEMASTIIKKLLTEQMQSLLFFHGANLASLHKYVNKEVLPPDLGGEGSNITTLDWYHFLLECSQNLVQNKSYKFQYNPQYSKIPS